jgi:hypothetical protein
MVRVDNLIGDLYNTDISFFEGLSDMSTITKSQQSAYENLVTQVQKQFPGKPRLWVMYRLTDKGITPETM